MLLIYPSSFYNKKATKVSTSCVRSWGGGWGGGGVQGVQKVPWGPSLSLPLSSIMPSEPLSKGLYNKLSATAFCFLGNFP